MLANTPVRIQPRHTAMLLGLAAIATVGQRAAGQTQAGRPVPAGEPARFLQRYIGLSADEVQKAERGEVVTKVLKTSDQDEVAIFGIVTIDQPRSEVVRRVADLNTLLRTPNRTSFGVFKTPATPADVSAFSAESSDLDAIKDCKPGDCDVKMPTANIDEFRRSIDWSSSATAKQQVETLVRQRAADYVNRYRAGGTAAMVEYGDQKTAGRAADVFKSLLAESPYLFEYVGPFQKYLAEYPAVKLPDVTDAIYWASDAMPSMRPILSINHLSIYSPPGSPLTLLSNKQLYASHYFLGAFTLTTILDRPTAPGGRGSYFFVVERMRFDHLPGGLLNIRGRVIGKMHDAMQAELTQRKRVLEGRG
jgi:hypothetical protein